MSSKHKGKTPRNKPWKDNKRENVDKFDRLRHKHSHGEEDREKDRDRWEQMAKDYYNSVDADE
jgi:hypothetical protein